MRFLPEESLIIGKLKSLHSHSERWLSSESKDKEGNVYGVGEKSFNMAFCL